MKIACLSLLFALTLTGAVGAAQGSDEREKLLERQKKLSAGIETLKREQDYLLFQKTMYASDSKYLIINITAKTGQLKYKNRVLKDFHFTLVSGRAGRLAPGAIMLTKKIEGPKERNALIFGKSLILQGKHAPKTPLEAGIPHFSLSKKDSLSVFYAIEVGAKAYVIR
jgi:hypothetical protein